AEAGHRAIDNAGIDRLDRFVIELVALEVADLVILYHHVAGSCEFADDLLAFASCDIDGHRLLVAIGAKIKRVVVVLLALWVGQLGWAEGARVVAAPRTLDPDH